MKFNVTKHVLVPEHVLLSDSDAKSILKEYNIAPKLLPRIVVTDPCAKILGAKPGQIIKIIRKSPTAGTSVFYRLVVNE